MPVRGACSRMTSTTLVRTSPPAIPSEAAPSVGSCFDLRRQPLLPLVDRLPLLRGERPGVALEHVHAAPGEQVRHRGHADLLQQAQHHLRGDRVGGIGQQLDLRPARREAGKARPEPLRHHHRHVELPALHQLPGALPVEGLLPGLGLEGPADREPFSFSSAPSSRVDTSEWSSSTTPTSTRTDAPPPPRPPKTMAKMEKKAIGSRNVMACTTRSRRRCSRLTRMMVPIIRAAPFR